jgi:hypothetical protein
VRRVGLALIVAAVVGSRCDSPRGPIDRPAPKAGDFVKLRGTLGDDVDCRLLKVDDGRVYSLSVRVPRLINGSKVCIHGTVAEVSQCLTQPMIEVESVRPWTSCP